MFWWNIELCSFDKWTNVLYLAEWKHSKDLEQNLASIALLLLSLDLITIIGVIDWAKDRGTGCFENMRIRPRIRSSSHSSFWKLENGKGEKWEENKLIPQLRSGNGFSWSGFSTLSRPSRSSSESPGHLTFFQRITWDELHENIKGKYHRRSDVSKLFLCLQQKGMSD